MNEGSLRTASPLVHNPKGEVFILPSIARARLELGGSNDQKNLWPESYRTEPYNAHVKDKLENRMHALIRKCLKEKGRAAATAMLKQFQHEIATDWVAAYHKYVSPTP